MDTVDPLQFVLASFIVLGLLGLLAVWLKFYGNKFSGGKIFLSSQAGGRIAIEEIRYIDSKSKLLLVRRDDVEHLLLISDDKAIIVEGGIKRSGEGE